MACLMLNVSGCINIRPTPTYASTGDIVNIGLGGIKRNSFGTTLTEDDVIATITSDADGLPYQVKVLGLYRAFPDHTSQYAVQSLDRNHTYYKEVQPYDGQWWITLQLVEHDSENTEFLPLPLAAGPAVISISSAALIDTGWENEGTLSSFPIEMVADPLNLTMARVRQPDPAEPYLFGAYKPEKTLTVQPDMLASTTALGGMQIKLDYSGSSLAAGTPLVPRLVPVTHDPNINIIQNTIDHGDGTYSLIAMVTNPNGFVDLEGDDWAIGKSTHDDLNFAITLKDADKLEGNWQSRYTLDQAESFFVDDNGDVVASITPTLGRSF